MARPHISARVSSDTKLRLVTQNMYEGTNFQEVSAAQTQGEFAQAVTTTLNNIKATNPAERAVAMAREIAATRPHFVAVQEASIVQTGGPPATIVQSDLLQSLLDELARRREHYTVVSALVGLDAPPSAVGFPARLTTQDAVLARSDLSPSKFSWSNVQAHYYQVVQSFQSPLGPIPVPRGFISLDASINGHAFRFVTTHLERVPQINAAQASELVAVAAASTLPVVMAGDFNAVASDSSDPSFAAYRTFITAGFHDAWTIANRHAVGFTCCQAGDLRNASSALNQRIDLVLVKGGFRVQAIHRLGFEQSQRTPSGLWPSDHAGLAAVLVVP